MTYRTFCLLGDDEMLCLIYIIHRNIVNALLLDGWLCDDNDEIKFRSQNSLSIFSWLVNCSNLIALTEWKLMSRIKIPVKISSRGRADGPYYQYET